MFNTIYAAGVGLRVNRATQQNIWGQARFAPSALFINAPLIAFGAATAEKGEKLPEFIGGGASILAYPALAGIASIGLCLIPGIGPIAAGILGTVLSAYPDQILGSFISRNVRTFSETNERIRHLEMGGRFVDSELASRQRMYAIQDMNSAMIPSRRYLGQEALLMHR